MKTSQKEKKEKMRLRNLTFGELIDALEAAKPQAEVVLDSGKWDDTVLTLGPQSRGPYAGIIISDPPVTVDSLLRTCQYAQAQELQDSEKQLMWAVNWKVEREQPAVVAVVDRENTVLIKTSFAAPALNPHHAP